MKLELKHLAGYLPYWLKRYCPTSNVNIQIYKSFDFTQSNIDFYQKQGWKPILRPLSDLTKEIDHTELSREWENKSSKVIPNDLFKIHSFLTIREDGHFSINNGDGTCTGYTYQSASYNVIQLLLSWHFDIYGLIYAGLAIDINTLK